MIASREEIKKAIDQLNDAQLEQVAVLLKSIQMQKAYQRGWQPLMESLDKFSDDFMETREQPPLDVRESLE